MKVMLAALVSLFRPDERFITHRFHSSRLALAVALISIVSWFNYELIANQRGRWDLVAIAGVTALTKTITMVYYWNTTETSARPLRVRDLTSGPARSVQDHAAAPYTLAR